MHRAGGRGGYAAKKQQQDKHVSERFINLLEHLNGGGGGYRSIARRIGGGQGMPPTNNGKRKKIIANNESAGTFNGGEGDFPETPRVGGRCIGGSVRRQKTTMKEKTSDPAICSSNQQELVTGAAVVYRLLARYSTLE